MGIAASQARLLLLTARKSDMEYRAQVISQRKIVLAMQTEQLARDYSTAISNRVLKLTWNLNSNDGSTVDEVLTYAGLTAKNSNIIGQFRVIMPSEAYAAANGEKLNYKIVVDKLPDGADPSRYQVIPNINSNVVAFQNALRNGSLYVQKLQITGEAENATNVWKTESWQGAAYIKDELNTNDDAMAQSMYEAKSLIIQNQDKMLDLELKQVETQQKAADNEMESVKKILDKNIEKSFKTFA